MCVWVGQSLTGASKVLSKLVKFGLCTMYCDSSVQLYLGCLSALFPTDSVWLVRSCWWPGYPWPLTFGQVAATSFKTSYLTRLTLTSWPLHLDPTGTCSGPTLAKFLPSQQSSINCIQTHQRNPHISMPNTRHWWTGCHVMPLQQGCDILVHGKYTHFV